MKRIDRILTIVSDDEQKAVAEMIACQRYYDEQSKLLNELIDYEQEYKKKFSLNAATGIAIESIHNYHNFMARLKLTTEQQNLNVDEAHKKLVKATMTWQSKRKKRFSLENLNSRLDARHDNELSRREQKEQDDMASAKFQRIRPKH